MQNLKAFPPVRNVSKQQLRRATYGEAGVDSIHLALMPAIRDHLGVVADAAEPNHLGSNLVDFRIELLPDDGEAGSDSDVRIPSLFATAMVSTRYPTG